VESQSHLAEFLDRKIALAEGEARAAAEEERRGAPSGAGADAAEERAPVVDTVADPAGTGEEFEVTFSGSLAALWRLSGGSRTAL
jgi:hypothetical protein